MSSFDRKEYNHDYYKILGLHRAATAEEIKKAFQASAKANHPDINKTADAAAKFQLAKEAYDVLRDPRKRMAFDNKFYRLYRDEAEEARFRARAEAFRKQYQSTGGFPASSAAYEDLFEGPMRAPGGRSAGKTFFMRLLDELFRPRMVVAVPLVMMASWYITTTIQARAFANSSSSSGEESKVRAWQNPQTGKWEDARSWSPQVAPQAVFRVVNRELLQKQQAEVAPGAAQGQAAAGNSAPAPADVIASPAAAAMEMHRAHGPMFQRKKKEAAPAALAPAPVAAPAAVQQAQPPSGMQ